MGSADGRKSYARLGPPAPLILGDSFLPVINEKWDKIYEIHIQQKFLVN